MVESGLERIRDSSAARTLDGGLDAASAATRSTMASAKASAEKAYSDATSLVNNTRSQVDEWLTYAKQKEDVFFGKLTGGVEYCIENPYVGYPVAGAALLLAMPGLRRFILRNTVASFKSPETIVRKSEERIGLLKVKVEEFSKESQKLESRMLLAEEEMLRGRSKLKATRSELQRLAGTVGSSHKVASGVVQDLRMIKKMPKSMELRAEAAKEEAALLAQKNALERHINRIMKQDI